MDTYLLSSAFREFIRPKRTAAWIIVALSMFLIGKVVLGLNPDQSPTEHYSTLSGALVFRLLPLVAAIFSMAVVAQEVEQKTIVYLLTRPISRWKLITYRTLAAAIVVFLISIVSAIMVALAAFGKPFDPVLGRDLLALAIGSLAYTALFVTVSILINRAMIVCLLFAFAWETSIPNMPGDMYWLSVNSYLTSIAHRPETSGQKGLLDLLSGMFGSNTISMTTAWTVLIVLSVACLAFSGFWFSHNEYVPREDAE